MRRLPSLILALAATSTFTGCTITPAATHPTVEQITPPPCVDDPELVAAVDTLLAATRADAGIAVYGAPGGRLSNVVELLERADLAAMRNPLGSGILVSIVQHGGKALARDTAHRTGWLILDGSVYPVDIGAAQAFGLLWDGYPDDVKQTTGLGQNYFGLDDYGVTEFVAYNADSTARFYEFLDDANALCSTPTVWG